MSVRHYFVFVMLAVTLAAGGCAGRQPSDLAACAKLAWTGFRPVATERAERFLGKLEKETVRCRGGDNAVEFRDGEKTVASRDLPWVDWQNYWATGDSNSRAPGLDWLLSPNRRGIRGALLDLEHQRMELIKFNLFDNSGTYQEYVQGREGVDGAILMDWTEMRLPTDDPEYKDNPDYKKLRVRLVCPGELKRFRTLTGICNDTRNPLMGSTGRPFARNVEFETTFPDRKTTFPDSEKRKLVRDQHGDRLGLLKPNPQVISRELFTRKQSQPDKCQKGRGLPKNSPDANCDYKKAPFFNVLAAFWIQFMTHDWFSHLEEGHNREDNGKPDLMPVSCKTQFDGEVKDDIEEFGCRPNYQGDQIDRASVAKDDKPPPPTFPCEELKQKVKAKTKCLNRAYKTTMNMVTAWWDASQIYGYDTPSLERVKRDRDDKAKLLLKSVRATAGEKQGYLPKFEPCDPISLKSTDPINPAWCGQEATAFPDNWSIGLSFFHNVFAREHNKFVDEFRERAKRAKETSNYADDDSGLRNPDSPDNPILYWDVTDDELFQIARLVVSAEIAKIHTIEWTTQLLYNEPLYQGMNANWHGLFEEYEKYPGVAAALEEVVSKLGESDDPKKANLFYSAFAAGPGIFGLGNRKNECWLWIFFCSDKWSLKNPEHINGGTSHFGSPFNFPEEFVTVYRLHPMVPDLIEYRELEDPNVIRHKIPVVETFRGKATDWMQPGKTSVYMQLKVKGGLANWALSMGRQRLGKLSLQNHPQFLQNLPMPASRTNTGKLDVAALDIIRDRERGVPRFNEFRRQYGLKQLTSFKDFVDQRLPENSPERAEQERLADLLQRVYDHQIEDLDTVVGWLAEPVRPHGFAISETQFQVFILNASRRLFSDRFFTSSFRPEFYTHLGVEWVTNNGPDGKKMEEKKSNGHEVEVSPLKRVLLRTIPELAPELWHVVNVFDPWARDRGEYYSLEWKARKGAESDPAFPQAPAQ